jgi:dTDP-4-dehydrorhamnose reductase
MTDVLIIGSSGQLGRCLQDTKPEDLVVHVVNRAELDVSNATAVTELVEQKNPVWVINASAYTAVEQAERDSPAAFSTNSDGPANLAMACKKIGAKLIYISTDFVFDGESKTPYLPDDETERIGVYCKSKSEGQQRVINVLADAIIIRTAWVYPEHCDNFVKTMLRLMAERDQLGVVAAQRGCPSDATRGLANIIWSTVASDNRHAGIYHWTNDGEATWFEFANGIYEQATALGLLSTTLEINPIDTETHPTPVKHLKYSLLDCSTLNSELGLPSAH